MTTPFGVLAAALGGLDEGRESKRRRQQEADDRAERREGTALARAAQLFREQAPERERAQSREREGQLTSLIERAQGGDEGAFSELAAVAPDHPIVRQRAERDYARPAEAPRPRRQFNAERGGNVDLDTNEFFPVAGLPDAPPKVEPRGPAGTFVPLTDEAGNTTFYNPTTGDQKAAPAGLRRTQGAGNAEAEKRKQAVANTEDALGRFERTLEATGTKFMPGIDKAGLSTDYEGLQLQLKELYNLGVLNGPDLMLMRRVLGDPTSMLSALKTGGLSGDTQKAAYKAQIARVREQLGSVRNNLRSWGRAQGADGATESGQSNAQKILNARGGRGGPPR